MLDLGNQDEIIYNTEFQAAVFAEINKGISFREMLTTVAGVITSVYIHKSGSGLGGGSIEHCRLLADPFELACFDILEKYTGDIFAFRYLFMDIWTFQVCLADFSLKKA